MIFELFVELTKLALIVAALYFAIRAYVRRSQPGWTKPIEKRRLVILFALVLIVSAIKVSEDVLREESGSFDNAVLLFVHSHVPVALTGFFEAVTFSGSSQVLVPLATAATLALLLARRRFEASLVAASVIVAAIFVYVVKMAVGRARPELWETNWYWGSSFPSGHTLVVSAFATAVVLCINRIRPAAREFALVVALVWILIVAGSRLVLGVHWPTDVLAAACVGAFVPLAMSAALRLVAPEL